MIRLMIVAMLFVPLLAGCGKSPQDLVVGKWASADADDKEEVELAKDGTLSQDGKKVGTWKAVDDKTMEVTIEGKTEKASYTVNGDEMTIKTGKKETKFKRKK
jgi:hypothetical protein